MKVSFCNLLKCCNKDLKWLLKKGSPLHVFGFEFLKRVIESQLSLRKNNWFTQCRNAWCDNFTINNC